MSFADPNPQQFADIMVANGIEPGPDESQQQFYTRVEVFIRDNPNLRIQDFNHYIKNKKQFHQALVQKIKNKRALVGVGHSGKWIRTLYTAIQSAAKNSGKTGIKLGWNSLVIATSQVGMKELAKTTFLRTMVSKSTWIMTAAVCAIQIGYDFYQFCKGKISVKQFFINAGKSILTGVASAAGGAGGAALGACVGAAIAGPVGAIIGIVVGGIAGGVGAAMGTTYVLEKIEEACSKYDTPQKIYSLALQFYGLPINHTSEQLQASRKAIYMECHPDIWQHCQDLQVKQIKADRLAKGHQFYEIIVNYKK